MAVIKCPKCGRPLNQNTVTCPNCGHNLIKLQKNSNKTVFVIIIAAACVVAAIIAFILINYFNAAGEAYDTAMEHASSAGAQVVQGDFSRVDANVKTAYTAYTTAFTDLELTGETVTKQLLNENASGKAGSTIISQSTVKFDDSGIISVSWTDGEFWASIDKSGNISHGNGGTVGQNTVK